MTATRFPERYTEKGFALVTVMIMMGVLAALITAYFTLTMSETSSQRSQAGLNTGFNAAEGGLNLRAKAIRTIFQSYNTPAGTVPVDCRSASAADHGTGDYACTNYTIGKRTAITYLTVNPSDPVAITIPGGELYAGLHAQEYTYNIYSEAGVDPTKPEAIVMLRTKLRLVPLFQFAAFYNKDLEVLPGADMTLSGPVHVNGDLYLGTGGSTTLAIAGETTVTGKMYHGRKDVDSCNGKVTITDASSTAVYTPYSSVSSACSGNRKEVLASDLPRWGGNVQLGVTNVQVPAPSELDPTAGSTYWDKADLRVVMKLDGTEHFDSFEVQDASGTVDTIATNKLITSCSVIDHSSGSTSPHGLYNEREGAWINMLEVDMRGLLTCVEKFKTSILGGSKGIDDTSDGGLVLYFTVKGAKSSIANNYGVRIKDGAILASTDVADPAIKGLTVATDQALYVEGDYNKDPDPANPTTWKPASFITDSFNILSNSWQDSDSGPTVSFSHRGASSTTIYAAVLSGTDTTDGTEGVAGQDNGNYNGGLENYPRLHENWSGDTLTLVGSFVSLDKPRHVNGTWIYGDPYYKAPNRNFGYDTAFNSAANLPPLTPRFVYLRQEIFDRTYAR